MKKITLLLFLLICTFVTIHSQIPAFPGAEGFGKFALGARASTSPTIYHVTNLNDSGTGSFRDAVSQPNRIVVFDVAGVITIGSRLIFSSNVTVAGQTAPGDGIVVYGNGVSFSGAKNVIVRYVRFRMGLKGDSGKDAAGVANGSDMIFDHCSFTWGLDENFSISWDNKGTEPGNITISNSIIGQGIMVHACGGLIQTNGGISIIKNLYIDNKTRNPKVKGLNQFVNNVIYNWGSGGGYILGGDSEGPSWGAIESNYFIKGPNTGGTEAFVRGNENFQVCHSGNLLDYTLDGVLNGTLAGNDVYGTVVIAPNYSAFTNSPKPHPVLPNVLTAGDAYKWIIDSVGACLPSRDEVDKYMINELKSLGTKGALINGEAELALPNTVGNVFSAPKQVDTDNDGIPDGWEEANGLNKNAPADALILHESGYLNIERYINGITAGIPFVKYPTSLGIKAIDTNNMTLKWTNNAETATATALEVSTNGIQFTELIRLDPALTQYKIEGLNPNTVYYLRLKTIDGTKESVYSTAYKATTLGIAAPPIPCADPIPADKSIITSYVQTTLQWSNLSGTWGGTLYYDVYAGTSADAMEKVATSKTGTSLVVNLMPNTTYFWKVEVTNLLGNAPGDVWTFTSGKKPEREKVAYFPLNETSGTTASNDIQGFATAQNFTPTWTTGKIDNGVTIPASPSNAAFVQAHYDAITLGAESFTVEMWFKSAGGAVDWYLIHKGSHVANATTGATGKWFGIQYNKTGSNDRLTWGIDDNVTKTDLNVTGSTYFNNEWHHLVCMRDVEGDLIKTYVDGVLKGTKTDGTGNIAQIENLVIGNTNVNFVNAFGGSIDEVSIYKGALTADEVLENYNNGLKTGIFTPHANTRLSSYPNPFVNELNINVPELNEQLVDVQLHAISGQLVWNKYLRISNNLLNMKGLDFLDQGVYICTLKSNDNKTYSIKLIK
ncbi:MAG TPA: T9SS type A sorting domain-containing protein [Paludibacter sp.]|nr:T9SS type A sorting domain-containing protein [Paludibacter sp.]